MNSRLIEYEQIKRCMTNHISPIASSCSFAFIPNGDDLRPETSLMLPLVSRSEPRNDRNLIATAQKNTTCVCVCACACVRVR